jgi:hypothetical protein
MTEHQKEIWSGVLMATLFVGMLGVQERAAENVRLGSNERPITIHFVVKTMA